MARQRYKVDLEPEDWHRVRTRAIERGVTVGVIVEEALRQLGPTLVRAEAPAPRPVVVPQPVEVATEEAATELGALDDELAALEETRQPSFGAPRSAPKPLAAAKPTGRLRRP